MGALYDLSSAITDRLERDHAGDPMSLLRAKGALATKVGFLVSLVSPADTDDQDKIDKLKHAAAEMGIQP